MSDLARYSRTMDILEYGDDSGHAESKFPIENVEHWWKKRRSKRVLGRNS